MILIIELFKLLLEAESTTKIKDPTTMRDPISNTEPVTNSNNSFIHEHTQLAFNYQLI